MFFCSFLTVCRKQASKQASWRLEFRFKSHGLEMLVPGLNARASDDALQLLSCPWMALQRNMQAGMTSLFFIGVHLTRNAPRRIIISLHTCTYYYSNNPQIAKVLAAGKEGERRINDDRKRFLESVPVRCGRKRKKEHSRQKKSPFGTAMNADFPFSGHGCMEGGNSFISKQSCSSSSLVLSDALPHRVSDNNHRCSSHETNHPYTDTKLI